MTDETSEPFTVDGRPASILVCEGCGGIYAADFTEQHQRWHEAVAEALAKARGVYGWATPRG